MSFICCFGVASSCFVHYVCMQNLGSSNEYVQANVVQTRPIRATV